MRQAQRAMSASLSGEEDVMDSTRLKKAVHLKISAGT
jgi:hypothetical protein